MKEFNAWGSVIRAGIVIVLALLCLSWDENFGNSLLFFAFLLLFLCAAEFLLYKKGVTDWLLNSAVVNKMQHVPSVHNMVKDFIFPQLHKWIYAWFDVLFKYDYKTSIKHDGLVHISHTLLSSRVFFKVLLPDENGAPTPRTKFIAIPQKIPTDGLPIISASYHLSTPALRLPSFPRDELFPSGGYSIVKKSNKLYLVKLDVDYYGNTPDTVFFSATDTGNAKTQPASMVLLEDHTTCLIGKSVWMVCTTK